MDDLTTDGHPVRRAVTRTVMVRPLSVFLNVYLLVVAPAIAWPDRYQRKENWCFSAYQRPAAAVRVRPGRIVPLMVGRDAL
jgi:hypothetical protein